MRFRVNALRASDIWNLWSCNYNVIKVDDHPGTYLKRHSTRHRGLIFVLNHKIVVEMKLEKILLRYNFDWQPAM